MLVALAVELVKIGLEAAAEFNGGTAGPFEIHQCAHVDGPTQRKGKTKKASRKKSAK